MIFTGGAGHADGGRLQGSYTQESTVKNTKKGNVCKRHEKEDREREEEKRVKYTEK